MRIAFEYFIYTYGPTLALTILAAIFGTLGHAAKLLWDKYITTQEKREVAFTVVAFVEQAFSYLHGRDKLKKALETAASMLKNKGIEFSNAEMTVLIEAALAEFNDAFQKPLNDAATADSTRRVDYSEDRADSGLLDE